MELVKILHEMGFEFQRQRGSHVIFRHPDGRTVVVPNHLGEKLDRSLLRKIVKKDLGMNCCIMSIILWLQLFKFFCVSDVGNVKKLIYIQCSKTPGNPKDL